MNRFKTLSIFAFPIFAICLCVSFAQPAFGQSIDDLIKTGKLLVDDNFDRAKIGKKWTTNDGRAMRTSKIPESKFESQSQIKNNVLEIRRTQGSDHATSTKTNAEFKDAIFKFKFRLTDKNKFSLNFNDPKLKTVHAGHISKIEFGPQHILIQDQKLGTMKNEHRKVRLEGDSAAKKELNKKLAGFQKRVKTDIAAGQWHTAIVLVRGETYKIHVDNQLAAEFSSAGLGHATKQNMALAVPVSVDVDDLKIWSLPPEKNDK